MFGQFLTKRNSEVGQLIDQWSRDSEFEQAHAHRIKYKNISKSFRFLPATHYCYFKCNVDGISRPYAQASTKLQWKQGSIYSSPINSHEGSSDVNIDRKLVKEPLICTKLTVRISFPIVN